MAQMIAIVAFSENLTVIEDSLLRWTIFLFFGETVSAGKI